MVFVGYAVPEILRSVVLKSVSFAREIRQKFTIYDHGILFYWRITTLLEYSPATLYIGK